MRSLTDNGPTLTLSTADKNTNNLVAQLGQALPSDAPRLVRLPVESPVIYVGDIHGDLDAVNVLFSRFSSTDHVLVFIRVCCSEFMAPEHIFVAVWKFYLVQLVPVAWYSTQHSGRFVCVLSVVNYYVVHSVASLFFSK